MLRQSHYMVIYFFSCFKPRETTNTNRSYFLFFLVFLKFMVYMLNHTAAGKGCYRCANNTVVPTDMSELQNRQYPCQVPLNTDYSSDHDLRKNRLQSRLDVQ